jgi:hypothetical protein
VIAISDAADRVREATGRDIHIDGYLQGAMFCYQVAAYRQNQGLGSVITFGIRSTPGAGCRSGFQSSSRQAWPACWPGEPRRRHYLVSPDHDDVARSGRRRRHGNPARVLSRPALPELQAADRRRAPAPGGELTLDVSGELTLGVWRRADAGRVGAS